MRQTKIIGANLVLLSFCALCVRAEPPAPRMVSKAFQYSFQPPAGWQRKANLPPEWTAFLAPREQNFRANVVVHFTNRAAYKMNDEKQFWAQVKKEAAGHGDVSDTKRVQLGGQAAFAWRTHLHAKGVPDTENRQLYCIMNGHSYELTFTMLPALKSKYDPIYDKLVASFQFDK